MKKGHQLIDMWPNVRGLEMDVGVVVDVVVVVAAVVEEAILH